jgi:hypothetical protein
MTIGTVFEIIAAVFAIFGGYTVVKMIFFYVAYDKEIRNSVKITVKISKADDRETAEIKQMCAQNLARDIGIEFIKPD